METLQNRIAEFFTRVGTTEALASEKVTAAQVLAYMNDGMQSLADILRTLNPHLFMGITTVSWVVDTPFAFPSDFEELVDFTDSNDVPLRRMNYGGNTGQRTYGDYEIHGRLVYPRRAATGTVSMRYLRKWGNLHYGTCPGEEVDETDTVIWLENDPAAVVGKLVNQANYYTGLRVAIHSGTGAAQHRHVVYHGYSPFIGGISFGYLQVDTEWEPEPDETSVYCLLPGWPEAFDELLVWEALARCPIPAWQAFARTPEHTQLKELLFRWAKRSAHQGEPVTRSINDVLMGRMRGV